MFRSGEKSVGRCERIHVLERRASDLRSFGSASRKTVLPYARMRGRSVARVRSFVWKPWRSFFAGAAWDVVKITDIIMTLILHTHKFTDARASPGIR